MQEAVLGFRKLIKNLDRACVALSLLLVPLTVNASTAPLAPTDPTEFVHKSDVIPPGINAGNYCYMGAVYVLVKEGDQIKSTSVIWNFEQNRPLKCDEYWAYYKKMESDHRKAYKQYSEEYKEYRRENPLPRTNPR